MKISQVSRQRLGLLARGAFVVALSLLAAVAMRKLLLGGLEGRIVWVTFYPAVMVASMMAGWAAGIAAALGTCAIALYAWPFFVTHPFIKDGADWLGLYAFLFNCVLIAGVSQGMRNAQRRALEAKRQAEEAKASADAASRAKSQFLANMSHEIRTPMNAVLGFSQLLERDRSLSDDARSKVSVIQKSGAHLLGIINDVLEMSRIESGKLELRTVSIDLHDLLNDMAMLFRQRAREKGLEFRVSVESDLPRYVEADLGKLRQILFNLLGNAIKFTREGSVELSAHGLGGDRIAIEIGDTGIGISHDQLDRIFHAFERTWEGEQMAGGTGLGLAICRQYADLLGGDLVVQSEPGKGSRFLFSFPAPASNRRPMDSNESGLLRLSDGETARRILVVDDMPANRELLRALLEPMGFEVAEASDGEAAIACVEKGHPHLVLMDMVMPGIGGIEATRRLRQAHPAKELAIVGVSASAFREEKEQFLSAGLDGFLSKPVLEGELQGVLSRHFALERCVDSQTRGDPDASGMPEQWLADFRAAVLRGSIRKLAELGDQAKAEHPALAAWIADHASRYELDALARLSTGNPGSDGK